MRVRLVLLLAATAFYTNAEVDSVATDSTPSTPTSRHLRAAEKDDASVSRFLRTAAGKANAWRPSVRLPNVPILNNLHLPNVPILNNLHLPDVPILNNLHLPNVQMPDLHLPNVQMPDLHLPDMQMPDLHLPDVQMPDLIRLKGLISSEHPKTMLARLKPDLPQQKLLEDANFGDWVAYAKKYKGSTNDPDEFVVDMLREHFEDDVLSKIFSDAMESRTTKTLAKALNTKLNDKVLAEEKLAAMKRLVDQLAASFVENKLHGKLDETAVMKWLQDMGSIDESAAFQVLLSYHKESDVFKMLFAAQEKQSAVAERFLQKLSERWKLQDNHPKVVFVKMMLHQDEKFLNRKALKIWEDYATDFTRRHNSQEMNQLELLSTYLGDADLFRILAVAKKSKSKDMAEKLQQEWVNSLLNDKVLPSEALGKLFPFQELADLTNPNWRVWFEYVERFHKTTKYEDMVYTKREELIDYYRLVWKKLEKAKKQTNADATKMQDDLLDSLLSADFTTTSVRRIIEGTNHKKFIAYHEEYDKKHKAVLRAKHPI